MTCVEKALFTMIKMQQSPKTDFNQNDYAIWVTTRINESLDLFMYGIGSMLVALNRHYDCAL